MQYGPEQSRSVRRFFGPLALAGVVLFAGLSSEAQAQYPEPNITNPDRVAAYPPVRIVGNLYYVGTRDLASYLVATDAGHILINSGYASSVPMIRNNIEALGFNIVADHRH